MANIVLLPRLINQYFNLTPLTLQLSHYQYLVVIWPPNIMLHLYVFYTKTSVYQFDLLQYLYKILLKIVMSFSVPYITIIFLELINSETNGFHIVSLT